MLVSNHSQMRTELPPSEIMVEVKETGSQSLPPPQETSKLDGVSNNAQPGATANDDPSNNSDKDPNSLEDPSSLEVKEATIQENKVLENELLRDIIEDNSEVLESLIVPVYAPSNTRDVRRDGGETSDNDDEHSTSAVQPSWDPKASSFPLPKLPEQEGSQQSVASAYVAPRIASSLKSFHSTWAKYNTNAISDQQPIGNRFDDQIEQKFRAAIFFDKVDVIADTSITGKYAGKVLIPYGFEPSTEEACKQEDYPIIKINMGEVKEERESENEQKLSPLAFYQNWDPVTMKYEPQLKGSSPKLTGVKRAFPLGAAAAGTRAALLSFMSARTEDAGSATQGTTPTIGFQAGSNMNEMNHSSEMSIHNGYGDHSALHSAHVPSQQSFFPPQKVMFSNDTAFSNHTAEHGVKKIENVWKKKLVQRADKSRGRSREENSDNESYTDSSSKRTLETDSKSDSSLRRTKRKRKYSKKYE